MSHSRKDQGSSPCLARVLERERWSITLPVWTGEGRSHTQQLGRKKKARLGFFEAEDERAARGALRGPS